MELPYFIDKLFMLNIYLTTHRYIGLTYFIAFAPVVNKMVLIMQLFIIVAYC